MGYANVNINPKKNTTGDCSIRAVGAATGLGWDKAYEQLVAVGFVMKLDPADPAVVEKVLVDNGFCIGKVVASKGSSRPKVYQMAEEHPNWNCVLRVANHYVATVKGNYVDTWDSGGKSVYKYWYKSNI